MSGERRRLWLPDWMMACIKAIASTPSLPMMDRLTGVLTLVRGWASVEFGNQMLLSHIAIPAEQYDRITTLLTSGREDAMAKAFLATELADQGPDTFDP